jgi:hypothetical protein
MENDEVWLDYEPYVREPKMFFKTTSGKDINWNVKLNINIEKTRNLPELNPLLLYNQSEMMDKLLEFYK